jgi:hypothetical protein
MNEKIVGAGNISAQVIADSITKDGIRLTTFEIEVHRFVWSEFMTHRVFSRNSESSRAIPVKARIQRTIENPAMPIHWGQNKPGMQAEKEITEEEKKAAIDIWKACANDVARYATVLENMGVHKQVVNRLLEPFAMNKAVFSTTEMENFLELRLHKDADPHIHELARCVNDAFNDSSPKLVLPGQWHLPYAEDILDLDTAIKVSASCCAQVSYRKLDTSIEKAIDIYDKLVSGEPVHASPFEHQATPAINPWVFHKNFKGWVQQREILGF